jgi:homocysteine S-methyltransferase
MTENPLRPFIDAAGYFLLDGGLATELEARGHDLNDRLWSARLLVENPDAIRALHYDYLVAGADCVIGASYQASFEGFAARGLSVSEATELLQRSVTLASEARDAFWADPAHRTGRRRPLVAASIGPYGAYLADGSEYRGDYAVDEQGLMAFHRRRWQTLARAGADILACETIPSFSEARVLQRLLRESPGVWAWFSFTCRDEAHISDGTPIADCAAQLEGAARVAAIGVNCTPPRLIPALVRALRAFSSLPVMVYPNSGETYDASVRGWHGERDPGGFAAACLEWRRLGAEAVGGCCRTGPAHIAAMRAKLDRAQPSG